MALILEITENTLAKLQPKLAAELPVNQIQPLAKGKRLVLHSYAYADAGGGFNGHIKFAIANPEDWLSNLNTWFVYEGHARVLQDNQVVYPPPPSDELDTQYELRITQNTYLKREPQMVTELSADERYLAEAGQTYPIQAYAFGSGDRDFNGHIKFTLADRTLNGYNTWYVFEGHSEVLVNGKVVYPQVEHERPQLLRIIRDTVLKRRPVQSPELSAEQRISVEAGTEYILSSYAYTDAQGEFNDHIKFALAPQEADINGYNTWFVYANDAQVFYDGELVYPLTPPTGLTGIGEVPIGIKLPGFVSTFYLNESIIPGGNFTWAEATKNGSRIPATSEIVNNILVLAELLQRPREQIGRPFIVTSWYRDPITNREAGGATFSRHLFGQAVDFYVEDVSSYEVGDRLEWWPGGMGVYPGWVHLDTGPRRRWYR